MILMTPNGAYGSVYPFITPQKFDKLIAPTGNPLSIATPDVNASIRGICFTPTKHPEGNVKRVGVAGGF